MPRFVVHYHITPETSDRPNHWDLMLENRATEVFNPDEKTLETWALESQPVVGRKIKAQQLGNHRAWFLENEGALSGGRGSVTRQLSGEFEWLETGDRFKRIKLVTPHGDLFLHITRIAGTEFTIEVTASAGVA